MTDSAVSYDLRGPVAVVTIDDGKANAISHDLCAAVNEALGRARDDDAVSAVVIAGRPGRFSAGFDLATMTSGADAARELLRVGADLAIEIHGFPKPVVLAVTGHALAMGAILCLSADTRIGAEGSFKLGLNEVAIGMPVPRFAVTLANSRLSHAAFTEAVNHATIYDPESAVAAGYLDRAVPADDVVEAAVSHATELAERLRPNAFVATRQNCRGETIAALRAGLTLDVAEFVVELPES